MLDNASVTRARSGTGGGGTSRQVLNAALARGNGLLNFSLRGARNFGNHFLSGRIGHRNILSGL